MLAGVPAICPFIAASAQTMAHSSAETAREDRDGYSFVTLERRH